MLLVFLAALSLVSAQCVTTFTTSTGSVTDGYATLGRNISCQWYISPTIASTQYLKISITEFDYDTLWDQLVLVDVKGNYLTGLQEIPYLPFDIYTDERVTVNIRTHATSGSSTHTGFTLSYTVVDKATTVRPCSFTLNDLNPNNLIASVYPPDVSCYWYIVPPIGVSQVEVTVLANTLSSGSYLELWGDRITPENYNTAVNTYGVMPLAALNSNGVYPRKFLASAAHPVTVRFNRANANGGFKFTYAINATLPSSYPCFFYFDGVSGSFSDMAPTPDYHNMTKLVNNLCYYLVNRQPGYLTLNVTLTMFDTDPSDYLYIYEGGCFMQQAAASPRAGNDTVATGIFKLPSTYSFNGDLCFVFVVDTTTPGSPDGVWSGWDGTFVSYGTTTEGTSGNGQLYIGGQNQPVPAGTIDPSGVNTGDPTFGLGTAGTSSPASGQATSATATNSPATSQTTTTTTTSGATSVSPQTSRSPTSAGSPPTTKQSSAATSNSPGSSNSPGTSNSPGSSNSPGTSNTPGSSGTSGTGVQPKCFFDTDCPQDGQCQNPGTASAECYCPSGESGQLVICADDARMLVFSMLLLAF